MKRVSGLATEEGVLEKDFKIMHFLFHIDADCLCAVVTMSSEHDQQALYDVMGAG